jgi:hypothetical protein
MSERSEPIGWLSTPAKAIARRGRDWRAGWSGAMT